MKFSSATMPGVGGRGSSPPPGMVLLLGLGLLAAVAVTGAAAQSGRKDECYQFTWISNKNSTDCDEQHDAGIPCEEPFIRTIPANLPPNISQIVEACPAGGDCPAYTCDREDQCLRYVLYDIYNKPQYMSLLCGALVDVTKGANDPLVNNCFYNKNGTTTIEACVCNHNLCNTSAALHSWGLASALLVAVVAVVYGASSGY